MSNLDKLQEKIGYKFNNINYLIQAITHKSSGAINYERLEFVGDGALDFVIAVNLYTRYPDLSEGQLSSIRSSLVNRHALAEIAKNIHLGECLRLGDGEIKSGGRDRVSILSDSVEALFAAVYLDSSFDDVCKVIEYVYRDQLDECVKADVKDAKSKLQEYLQGKGLGVPKYSTIATEGPNHDSTFMVECKVVSLGISATGSAKTKKDGSQVAAAVVLEKILRENLA